MALTRETMEQTLARLLLEREIEQFLYMVGGLGPVISTGNFSCPAFFEAARELADGYPDPETGECTHLSSAFEVNAYSAFVIHPEQDNETRTAQR